MRLFFDTETTSKYPEQARVVQLGAVLCDDDLTERAAVDVLVIPEGFTIPAETTAIHGISTEIAKRGGIPLRVALAIFSNLARNADEIVAHNLEYDARVLASEFARFDKDLAEFLPKRRFCTMQASTPICRLPGRREGEFKWPKLIEAHRHFFGEGFDGAHSAIADVRACVRVYGAIAKTIPPVPPSPPPLA